MNEIATRTADPLARPASPLSRNEASVLTRKIRDTGERLLALIVEAHDKKAWAAMGYRSWEEYTRAEFDMSRTHSYRLLTQAHVVAELERAAGVELGPDVVSGRAAAEIAPQIEKAREKIREETRGTKKKSRPQRVREVITDLRDRRSPETPTPTPPPAAPTGETRSLMADVVAQLVAIPAPTAAATFVPADLDRLSDWVARVRAELSRKASSKRRDGTAAAADCRHPANRRIGTLCGACGKTV